MIAARPTWAAPAPGAEPRRTIPFDQTFRFALPPPRGEAVLKQAVTVSVEGTFVATAIGYGLVPARTPRAFGVRATLPPRRLTLAEVIAALGRALDEGDFADRGAIGPVTARALGRGIRLNPDVARRFLLDDGAVPLDPDDLGRLFEATTGPGQAEEFQFLYALHDDASGRAFQSEPILSTAGLGSAEGERPFRHFAQPIALAPRSTLRLEITPLTSFEGELHLSLHGYKVLGESGTPTRPDHRRTRRRTR